MKPKMFSFAVIALAAMTLLGAGAMPLVHPAQAQTSTPADYDADDDGLIEVTSLAQLNAIRWDLNGDGTPTSANASNYSAAFPNAASGMGCPSTGCTGYELTTNLDFDTNGDGRTDVAGDTYWNSGAGWDPIVDSARSGYQNATFHATFEGNARVISGLYIDRSGSNVGLFGRVWGGEIRNLGLEGVIVKGGASSAGGLVGNIRGGGSDDSLISATYVTGSVTGGTRVGGLAGFSSNEASINASYAAVSVTGTSNIGGLVGNNHSSASITASYATGAVAGGSQAGGLVGNNQAGSITASYATGPVSGNLYVGGLVGDNDTGSTISASYWDTQTSGQSTSDGGVGKTTSELQSPTGYSGIYADWNLDLDGDGTKDDPWDFGTSSDYPNLMGVGPISPVEMDRAALLALYNATDGANWTNNTNWLSDEPLGDWHGVTTDADGRVTAIDLTSNKLAGGIPTELGNLSNLVSLKFTFNDLAGTLPTELGSLSNLQSLEINFNDLTGTIPAELGDLSTLRTLNLYGNDLSGAIPTELGSLANLTRLSLGANELTGAIPTELGDLSNLTRLELEDGNLTGGIPTELGSLSNLTSLELDRNDLTGAIPTELGNLTGLTWLSLHGNQLTGTLPQSLTNLTALTHFYFHTNAGLCAPTDAAFQNWLQAIPNRGDGPNCSTPPGAPTIGTVTPGTGSLAVSWTAPSSDGGSAVTAYDLRHIKTSADETVDSIWTVVDDAWTTGGGTLQHTLIGLIGGTQYDLQIRAVNALGDGPWSATTTGTPTPVTAQTGPDYDTDDDGLIEVGSLAKLDAIRYDLDGDGTPTTANASDYAAAFPNAASGMGCPSTGCTGYELTANLDFDTNGDGRTNVAGDDYWNSGSGWDPIVDSARSGYQDATFHATFEGNSHVVLGLYIDRSGRNVGLFGSVWGGEIRNLGLEGVAIKGGASNAGGLVGRTSGSGSLITASYVTGSVSGGSSVGGLVGFSSNGASINSSYAAVSVAGTSNIGGLVGTNHSRASVSASYATGAVSGVSQIGGLVGSNQGGAITATYATGAVSGTRLLIGGLVGDNDRGTISASYWDTQTSGQSTSDGGVGKTTSELQSPTGYSGIYADWNVDLDGDGTGDDPWDFGTTSDYPVLDYVYVARAPASPPGAPTLGTITPGTGSLAISWTAPSSDGGSAITAYDLRHIETSADETVDSNWTVVDDVWTTGGGTLQYTLTGLTGGTQYDLQIRAVNSVGDGPWSATTTGTPTTAGTDYDADDDGLIEITSVAQLNAVRWDLDGDGTPTSANASGYSAAFSNAVAGMGCPQAGCTGYELDADIGLDVAPYNTGEGWEPISSFATVLEGNGHTINGLFINRTGDNRAGSIGLFAVITQSGRVQNLNLTDVDVNANNVGPRWTVGSLAGQNGGRIAAVSAKGTVVATTDSVFLTVGGLVGRNGITFVSGGTISASYADVTVPGSTNATVGGLAGQNRGVREQEARIVASYATGDLTGSNTCCASGGLVGHNSFDGRIQASYSTGSVAIPASNVGGLVGLNNAIVTDSYWDTTTSGQTTSAGGVGKTTTELQSPTGYTGIYAEWNVDLNGDGTGDDPWDFGTSSEYPVIDYVYVASAPVSPPGAPAIGTVTPGTGSLDISWTAPSSDGGSAITAYDLRHIETSADETVDSNWTVVDDVWTTGGGTLQHTLTGLTGGTQYDLQVRAANSAGDGPWSATATGTPQAGTCATGTAVPNAANNPGLVSDCETLLAARDTLAGTATLNWAASTPMSQWTGVTVAGTPQRVTRLSLLEGGLAGTIPSRLGDLANLVRLDLEANQLTGEIPAELSDLANLESMDLGGNQLSGEIPAELGDLSNLERLYLGGNQLTGEIPTELGDLSNLESLYLGHNQLTGEIPAELGSLPNLELLHLANNQLTGDIPDVLKSLTGLSSLYLANNQLTGCIPAVWRAVSNNDLDDLGLPYCDVLLSGLSVSPGSLVPAFDPYRTAYSASVGLSPITVTVSPTSDHNATIRFLDENDSVLADADRTTAGFQVAFGGTVPAVKITVTSQDGQATRTYVVTDVGEKYDANDDGAIDRDEVVSAIKDYFSGAITREEAFEIIKLYFVG